MAALTFDDPFWDKIEARGLAPPLMVTATDAHENVVAVCVLRRDAGGKRLITNLVPAPVSSDVCSPITIKGVDRDGRSFSVSITQEEWRGPARPAN